MSKPRDYHNAPAAHPSTMNPESLPPLLDVAKQYAPKGAKEPFLATMSRVANRIIDRVTGRAYSADELVAYFAGGISTTIASAIAADRALLDPFDGAPVIFDDADAGTAMTGTYTASEGNTLGLVSKVVGVLDPAPQLVIQDAATAGPNATLALASQAAGVVTVTPATNAGDKATAEITTSGTAMTVEHHTAGPGMNGKTITFELQNSSTVFGSYVTPSATLTAALDDGDIVVTLGTDAGTPGVLALDESSAAAGQLTITEEDAFAGAFNGNVKAQIIVSGVSTAFGVVATLYPLEAPTELQVNITLATTSEGVAIPKADTELVTAINAALAAVITSSGVSDFSADLLAEVVSDAKTFDSPQTWVTIAGGAQAYYFDSENSVLNLKTALELLTPDEGVTFINVTADGTGHVSGATTETFGGGGDNCAITSTLTTLKALLDGAPSTIIGGGSITGTASTVIVAEAGETLTGGTNADPEHLGTPAKIGRIASDGTDVWTAMKDDLTGTDSTTWVKTFTATP